jgi:hypothetical protein
MKKQNKSKEKVLWILIILLLLMSIILLAKNINLEQERDYYKEQMLDMCEINHISFDIIELLAPEELLSEIPELKKCDYWILGNE